MTLNLRIWWCRPGEGLWLWLAVGEGRGIPSPWDESAGSVKISRVGPAPKSQRRTVMPAQAATRVCFSGILWPFRSELWGAQSWGRCRGLAQAPALGR